MDAFTVVTQQHDIVGEGPIWIAREDKLYWVDILGKRLHACRLSDRTVTTWVMPEPLCWIVERAASKSFLAGFASGIAALSLDPVEIQKLHVMDHRDDHRLNDAKVDPAGRLWAGTMQESAQTATGRFFRLTGDDAPVCVDTGYLVPNGPAFSPDGGYLYHADSARRIVYRYEVADDGTLQDRLDFITFAYDWGLPDGMTIDVDGHLWVAHWDGSRISRFDPDGQLASFVRLPASRITSCAFGGSDLDRLFVTSAGLDRQDEPLAGAVFEVETGTSGVAPVGF